ncbi:MAG: carboxypeptidase regulatory-like domain-containing protein [Candidatus Acidiferrales bacterium]
MRCILRMCGVAACAAILFWGACLVSSQTLISLHGNVTDPSGAAIPNATVHLINSANNSDRTTTTDQRGAYAFAEVVPGTYRLLVEAQGFEKYEQADIHVAANARETLDIELKIEQVQQSVTVRAQNGDQCLAAQARILPDVGPGLRAIRRGPSGNYYVLTAPGAAVAIYSPDGKRIGQVPVESSGASSDSSIVYGSDLQVDSAGRVYVADRGANAIKIYSPDGILVRKIRVPAPVSVEPLAGGEIAVASLSSQHLVDVYGTAQGEEYRSFGDISDPNVEQCDSATFVCTTRINPQDVGYVDHSTDAAPTVNRSWFYGDSAGNIYINLAYRIVPTIRKYDGYGYRAYESVFPLDQSVSGSGNGAWNVSSGVRVGGVGTSANGSQSNSTGASSDDTSGAGVRPGGAPTAGEGGGMRGGRGGGMQANRMAFGVQITRRAGPTDLKPIVDAMGVDPTSQEVWAVIGGNLVHLDKDGNLAGYYCFSATDQAAVKPATILVEPDRILIGTDPFGIFQYPRPDRPSSNSAAPH